LTLFSPERADQIANRRRRGKHGGRSPSFDAEMYKQRNTVERAINKLSTGRRQPATTGAASSIAAAWTSPPSASGSAIPLHDLRDTPQAIGQVSALRANEASGQGVAWNPAIAAGTAAPEEVTARAA
jgi:hypothetical protein